MRVSCTTIESFRLWSQPDNEWFSEEQLIASIRGEGHDTSAMALGRAFESVLMDPDRYRVPLGFACAGYSFSSDTIAESLATIDRRGVFQVKSARAYGPHDVVAKADHLVGSQIVEWKTTASSFDIDKYVSSCQHQFMLDIFRASHATYRVFCLDDHGTGVVAVKSIETFTLYPYPALHDDCAELVREFSDYVAVRGLTSLLDARQQAAA